MKMINDTKWKVNNINTLVLEEFFEKNKEEFKYFGGDIMNLIMMCKFAHSKRIAGKHPKHKRNLTFEDIEKGFDNFVKNKKTNGDDKWRNLSFYI